MSKLQTVFSNSLICVSKLLIVFCWNCANLKLQSKLPNQFFLISVFVFKVNCTSLIWSWQIYVDQQIFPDFDISQQAYWSVRSVKKYFTISYQSSLILGPILFHCWEEPAKKTLCIWYISLPGVFHFKIREELPGLGVNNVLNCKLGEKKLFVRKAF